MHKETLYKVEKCIKESGTVTPTQIAQLTRCHISSVSDAIEVLARFNIISITTNGRTRLVTYNHKKE